jgi:hypothetical protein
MARPRLAARLAAGICGATAAFNVALILGAPWGDFTQGGRTSGSLDPTGRVFAGLSILILILMGLAILARAGDGPLQSAPSKVVTVLAWLTTGYATLAVLLNLISRSEAERNLWGPVSLVLVLLILYVMATTRRAR